MTAHRPRSERVLVNSSLILSVGYDDDTASLDIEFRSGSVYSYAGVPRQVHGSLLAAESAGAYFNRFIKGRYEFAKLTHEFSTQ